jgi:hypothetical protein
MNAESMRCETNPPHRTLHTAPHHAAPTPHHDAHRHATSRNTQRATRNSYYHNIGPPNDPGSCMHVNTGNVAKPTSLFKFLTQHGYNTGLFGKVTNDQSKVLGEISNQNAATFIDSPLE